MPYEIQDHLFYSDASPELLQFMAWGSTSNRAGYRTCLIATHSTKSSEYPTQTPTVSFNRYVMGSSETSDNVATSVNVEMISSVSGQGSAMFGGNLVPTLGSTGALQYWSDNNGPHYGFKPVNEVPASTAQDEGKVLTVDSNGDVAWAPAASGSDIVLVKVNNYANNTSDLYDDLVSLYTAGKTAILRYNDNVKTHTDYLIYYTEHLGDTDIECIEGFSISRPGYYKQLFINSSGYTFNDNLATVLVNKPDATESDLSGNNNSITGYKNTTRKLTLSTVNNITIVAENAGVAEFSFEIDNTNNSNDVMVTVTDILQNTFRHSATAGNTIGAGKYVQLTCVGKCWTLAEFEA